MRPPDEELEVRSDALWVYQARPDLKFTEVFVRRIELV